nr:unnamed protein product [Digitaria exilis]
MTKEKVRLDDVTLLNVLVASARTGTVKVGRLCHSLVMVNGVRINCYMGSSLISMYAKCGLIEDARKVFDGMHERNVVCWTSMISGYTQLGKELSVKNSLIDMYSKCGDVKKAYEIFSGLTERDVFSWTAMIMGFAVNGLCGEALDLFAQMEAEGKGLVERVVVIFYDKDHVPVEKFVFKIEVNQSYGPNLQEADLEFALRAFLIKLTVAEPVTKSLPSDGSWEITAYFRSLPADGDQEAQLWIPTDTKLWMQPPQITPIKSVSCDPLKMQLYLEHPSPTEPKNPAA